MAKKKAKRKNTKKRAAPKKARKVSSKKKAATKTRKSTSKKSPKRRGQISRGLDSSRATLIPETESNRTFAAGQSGDNEGLSDIEDVDSESVNELVEEGQDYEADVISGVERAADRQGEEVRTQEEEE